jgi:short-subunit dehydrogenase
MLCVERSKNSQLNRCEPLFEVNVFGVMRMIRAVVPQMRQQQAGRVITIGSLAGKRVLPVNGTYSATKFALEALSDALRLELAPFGMQVVLIEPGNIRTNFMATAQANAKEILSNPDSPYHALYQSYLRVMTTMRKQEPGPEIVSQVVQQAIEASTPKARYLVAVPFSNKVVLRLGDAARDGILKWMFKGGLSPEYVECRGVFPSKSEYAKASTYAKTSIMHQQIKWKFLTVDFPY